MVARRALADAERFADGGVVEALRDEFQHFVLADVEIAKSLHGPCGRLRMPRQEKPGDGVYKHHRQATMPASISP